MQRFVRRRLYDCGFFIILMIILGGFAAILHIDAMHPSGARQFILQAQAWLHGHLALEQYTGDTIILHGKDYVIYPPLPAMLMLPFVALLGDKFSDIWFTWIFAAMNIILLFRTLEVMRVRCITRRSVLENGIIALTFGFGTVALWLGLGGDVWFTAQIVSTFGIMLMLHSTLSRRWPLATLGAAIVLLSRSSEVLIGLVPLVVYLHDLGVGRREQKRLRIFPQRWPSARELALILTPIVLAGLLLLIRNKLYFDNFLSSGYDIQNQQDHSGILYGVVSWHYIWPNFVIDFLNWPTFSFASPFDVHPYLDLMLSGMGTNMFFSTPLLAIFLFAPQGKTSRPWLRTTLWVTIAVILVSVLTFCAGGWVQVGARYVLPLYPLLFLLLAQRAARLDVRWIGLAGLGLFINLLLAHTFWCGYRTPGIIFIAASAGIALLACVVALLLLHNEKHWQEKNALITIIAEPIFDEEVTESQAILK